MKLVTDGDKFDDLQPWFVGEIIEDTKRILDKTSLSQEQIKELCGEIAFSVAALIDGSSTFEVENIEYQPYLAFSEEESSMFYPGGSSYLHEYVYGVLGEIFEPDT